MVYVHVYATNSTWFVMPILSLLDIIHTCRILIFSDLEKFCPNDTKHERRKNHYSKNENTVSVDDIEQTQDGDNESRTVGGINVYVHHGGDSTTRTE